MNYKLIECIKLLLTFSMETSAEAEIKKDGRITKLSFDDKADSINEEDAKHELTTSSGFSFFTMHFNESIYKVKQSQQCVEAAIGVAQLITKVDIEKCHKEVEGVGGSNPLPSSGG